MYVQQYTHIRTCLYLLCKVAATRKRGISFGRNVILIALVGAERDPFCQCNTIAHGVWDYCMCKAKRRPTIASFAGDKLGLMGAQNLKFATSQVLRKGPRAGAEAVSTQPSGSRPSGRGPAAGECQLFTHFRRLRMDRSEYAAN